MFEVLKVAASRCKAVQSLSRLQKALQFLHLRPASFLGFVESD